MSKALKAVEKIGDQKKLARIAVEATTCAARQLAVEKLEPIRSQSLFARIAVADSHWNVRLAAIDRLFPIVHQPLFARIATTDEWYGVRRMAVDKLIAERHQPLLVRIAEREEDDEVLMAAIAKLPDGENQFLLAGIAKRSEYWPLLEAVISKLTDVNHLFDVARYANDERAGRAAAMKIISGSSRTALTGIVKANLSVADVEALIVKISDQDELFHIALSAKTLDARKAALSKLSDMALLRRLIALYGRGLKCRDEEERRNYARLLRFVYNKYDDASVRRNILGYDRALLIKAIYDD